MTIGHIVLQVSK